MAAAPATRSSAEPAPASAARRSPGATEVGIAGTLMARKNGSRFAFPSWSRTSTQKVCSPGAREGMVRDRSGAKGVQGWSSIRVRNFRSAGGVSFLKSRPSHRKVTALSGVRAKSRLVSRGRRRSSGRNR